jgi:hypothetical protein
LDILARSTVTNAATVLGITWFRYVIFTPADDDRIRFDESDGIMGIKGFDRSEIFLSRP